MTNDQEKKLLKVVSLNNESSKLQHRVQVITQCNK